jgi:two-component system, OmpR family, sensor histidine kinase BaeS
MSIDVDRERLALLVHEVRSPVAAVAAIAEALREDELDPHSFRELVRLALGGCRGIERIVTDAALGPLKIEEVDVAGLVEDAVAAAALAGGHVRATVDAPLPGLEADAVRLRQALDNLIANALAHAGSDDEVVVSARVTAADVVIAVSDRGRGIAPEDQDRIFEAGARAAHDTAGAGLGLAVVRAIAEAHGGTVQVDSGVGAGATFTMTLPFAKPS